MRPLILLLVPLLLLGVTGCNTKAPVTPPPPVQATVAPGPAAAQVSTIEAERASQAAASVAAAKTANAANPDGAPKTATQAELSIAEANLDKPKPEHAAAALERVNAALRGDLATAQSLWTRAEKDASSLREQLAAANAKAVLEAAAAADKFNKREQEWTLKFDELKRDADAREAKARQEAEAEMKRMIGYFFFGFSALCIVAGVACMTVLSAMAFVGPKVILGCFLSAAVLAATGVLLIRAMNSPWIGYGVAIVAVLATVTIVLAYANHKHQPVSPSP